MSCILAVIPMKGDEPPTQLTGFMVSSDEWLDAHTTILPYYGFYSFLSDGSTGFQAISATGASNLWAKCGGAYADGKYYCYTAEGSWITYTLTYYVLDATTFQILNSRSYTYKYADSSSDESLKAKYVPSAIGYDPINDKLYAFTHRFANSDGGQLAVIDRESGELTPIADTRFVSAMACDKTGQIFAIGLDGNLYKVSPDGVFTLIGHTGYYPTQDADINCGAVIDFRTGDMYWTLYGFADPTDRDYNRNGVTALLKVDTSTGAATVSWHYPRNELLSALIVENAHPLAPDNILDLTFKPVTPGSFEGEISFTIPSVTYGQTPLTGSVTVECRIDGTPLGEETAQRPGEKFSKKIANLSEGMHTASVTITANGHQSTTSHARHFFGTDIPRAVENLKLVNDKDAGTATLTWDQPETGVQGGSIDMDNIRYQIVRMPDGISVARSAKATTFSEATDFPFGSYYYRVQPYYNTNPTTKGGIATSNREKMGQPIKMPYSETFDTSSSFDSFTIIDANNDGGDGWEETNWKYDDEYACAFYYGKRDTPADDWLITPALELDPGVLYKMTYKYYAYYGYGSHIRVAVGSEPTVEAMNQELLDKEFTSSFSDKPGLTETIYFAPHPGAKFIGFHHLSETMEHLSIDDIVIEAYSGSTVPDRVSDATGVVTSGRKARLTFTLPTLTVAGNPLAGTLSVKILRGGVSLPEGQLDGKKPGETIEWIDNSAAQAMNIYTIIVSNEFGDGLGTEIKVDLSRGVPVSVTDVVAKLINNNQVELTWSPSTSELDALGNPVDVSSIRYLVYKPVPGEAGTEYRLLGRDLDICRFIDDDPTSGLGEGQNQIYYYVAPVNGDEEGIATQSNYVSAGKSYNMPFSESWPEQVAQSGPWSRAYSDNATWYVRHQGYEPYATGSIGIMTCESDYGQSNGIGGLLSPRIDLTSMENAALTFRMYRGPEYAESTQLNIQVVNGEQVSQVPGGMIQAKASEAGWQELTLSLEQFGSMTDASILFLGSVSPDNSIHIDDVTVTGSKRDSDVKISSLAVPASGREKEPLLLTATVQNLTDKTATGITLLFSVDDTPVGTVSLSALAAGESAPASMQWIPDETMTGYHIVRCAITSDDDNAYNNVMDARTVISNSNYPYLRDDLRYSVDGSEIIIEWDLPSDADYAETHTDSVEAYDAFAIDKAGSWKMADLDGATNVQFSDGAGGYIRWPNNGEPQAFIVFDTGFDRLPAMAFTPTSGRKMFASWAAAGTANNDYLISPELPGDSQLISFYARTAGTSGSEPFNVLASAEGTDPADFIKINGDVPMAATAEWTLFHFALPEGTVHFAINYVGQNGTGLLVDDIMYYGKPLGLVPDGYNIYRNGSKLNTELLTERRYADKDITFTDKYIYNVAPVYRSIESPWSEDLVVDLAGIDTAVSGHATAMGATGMIIVRHAEGSPVDTYHTDGRKHASAEGREYMAIPALPGIYIVRIGTRTFKVAVR